MAFPCPICGAPSGRRSSRMVTASTKEIYYSCKNDDCCLQFKTFECDPHMLAEPIKGGVKIPPNQIRSLLGPKKHVESERTGRVVHRLFL